MIATTNTENYGNIAEAIRTKGITGTFKPSEMAEAILSITSGDTELLTGSFTPTSANYVKGGHVDISIPNGKTVRAVIVAEATSDTTTVDRYAPDFVIAWLRRSSDIQAQVIGRYKSSTSQASSMTIATSTTNYVLGSSYINTDASAYTYCINWYGNLVRFKTYGNYRFRANKNYEYIIVLK